VGYLRTRRRPAVLQPFVAASTSDASEPTRFGRRNVEPFIEQRNHHIRLGRAQDPSNASDFVRQLRRNLDVQQPGWDIGPALEVSNSQL
ncbi:MAG: hypothetical protein ACE5I7_18160, partial [Candidatus Binatia bacterium]